MAETLLLAGAGGVSAVLVVSVGGGVGAGSELSQAENTQKLINIQKKVLKMSIRI